MAKARKTTKASAKAKAAKPIDEPTADDVKVLLTDALINVRDLSGRYIDLTGGKTPVTNAPLSDFSQYEPNKTLIPELYSARNSLAVKQAKTSLRAAVMEISFLEGVDAFVKEIAAAAGISL